jgi:hypothetical protein
MLNIVTYEYERLCHEICLGQHTYIRIYTVYTGIVQHIKTAQL